MHGDAMLAYMTRPAPAIPHDAGTQYRRRAIAVLAVDLDAVTRATRALLADLYPVLAVLPDAWDDAAALVGWVAPADLRPGWATEKDEQEMTHG